MSGAIEEDYNLPEQACTGVQLIERLNSHLENNGHRSAQYIEGVQDCIDLVNLVLAGPKPYPFLKG